MHTPLTVITAQPDLPAKSPALWQRLIVGTLLACTLLVQTGQVLAQYQNYGQNNAQNNGQNSGQPTTGYTPPSTGALSGYTNDGTLFMGGQRIGNPHQILHDAQIPAFMTITGFRATYSNVNDPLAPNYGQGTLAQMEAQASTGSDASVLFNRVYLTPNNPYPVVPAGTHNNYQTYQNALTAAQAANYLLTNADDGKTYAFKTLTASSRQAADLLIRELPNTSQFKSYADPNGGAVLMRVSQNGDAVALSEYLKTVKPYDYSWQPNFGTTFGQNGGQNPNNGAFSGWANSNNFAPDYSEGGAPAQSFQAFIKQLQDDAVANDKKVRSQTSANSLDLSGVNPNSLFGEGYNLFSYGSNSNPNRDLENDFLRRLQSGQLTAGSADYLEASRIAQERYRIAYATRLETGKPLQYSVADAQRKANELKLDAINPNELFGQGFDLFKYNSALRANGEAENALLARLQSGELTPGSADYLQATQIAQERLRLAYSQSLVPPEPKKVSKWKLIAGIVVGAVLTFVTAGALAPFVLSALTGATVAGATALIAGGFVAGTAIGAVTTAVAGIVAGAIGAIASTTITTGSFSEGLKAGGKALVSGSVKAIVGAAIGLSFASLDLLGTAGTVTETISNIAANTLSGAISSTILGGGSFADNLKTSAINSVTTAVADGIGKEFAGAIKDAAPDLGAVGTELAHGALGCVTGTIRAKGAEGCAAAAAGAIVGHLGAGWIDAATGYTLDDKTLAFYSGVAGGAAAAAVGKDDKVNVNYGVGDAAATNAVNNNYLTTRDLLKGIEALKTCTVGCDALRRVYMGDDNANGGLQQGTGALVSACKSGSSDCVGRVQDIKIALNELQKPETRALLGDRATDALIDRQVKDLGEAVTALQWGNDNAESRKAIFKTALLVAGTAVGVSLMVPVLAAVGTACATGGAPACIAATGELVGSALEGYATGASSLATPALSAAFATRMAAEIKAGMSAAESLAVIKAELAVNIANAPKLNSQLIAQEISNGHAFEKHVLQNNEFKEFGISTKPQFNDFVEKIVSNPAIETRKAIDGTTYYLDFSTKTIVIRGTRGEATAFRPDQGGVGWDNYLKSQVPKK